jgi:hypothetical protein
MSGIQNYVLPKIRTETEGPAGIDWDDSRKCCIHYQSINVNISAC